MAGARARSGATPPSSAGTARAAAEPRSVVAPAPGVRRQGRRPSWDDAATSAMRRRASRDAGRPHPPRAGRDRPASRRPRDRHGPIPMGFARSGPASGRPARRPRGAGAPRPRPVHPLVIALRWHVAHRCLILAGMSGGGSARRRGDRLAGRVRGRARGRVRGRWAWVGRDATRGRRALRASPGWGRPFAPCKTCGPCSPRRRLGPCVLRGRDEPRAP